MVVCAGPTSRAYKVKVTTSDIKGAGTDANVFLTLYGEVVSGCHCGCQWVHQHSQ